MFSRRRKKSFVFYLPFLFLLPSVLFASSERYNFLFIHPVYSGSHHIVMRNFGDYLISRGHSVTQVKFRQVNTPLNMESKVDVIDLEIKDKDGGCGTYISSNGEFDLSKKAGNLLWDKGHSVDFLPIDVFCLTKSHCETLLNNAELFAKLNSSHFDVAVVDLIANECGLGLAKGLDLPVASFWGFSFHGGETSFTSVFNNPSFVPMFVSGLSTKMNFFERVYNIMLSFVHRILAQIQISIAQPYVTAKFPHLPSLPELIHNIDLHLLNANFFTESSRLLTPKMKHIGGPHLRPGRPLPKEYQKFFATAKHGIIIFSMGYTGFEPKDVPIEFLTTVLTTFASLKQKVVMRFNKEFLPFLPKNVLVAKWLPQQDILAHEKTVAFVSHMGMFGFQESIYHRVPLVGLPIFCDQMDNMQRALEKGVGILVPGGKHNLKTDVFKEIIETVVYNISYKNNVNRLADIWREEDPGLPMERMAHWLEILAKYRDLSHLQIQDWHLNFFQYYCIDIFFAFVAVIVVIFWLFRCYLRWLRNRGGSQLLNINKQQLRSSNIKARIQKNHFISKIKTK